MNLPVYTDGTSRITSEINKMRSELTEAERFQFCNSESRKLVILLRPVVLYKMAYDIRTAIDSEVMNTLYTENME